MTPEPSWERLDARMLLLGPVRAIGGFLVPAAIATVGIGSSDGMRGLIIAAITLVVSIVVGVLPWLTTTYRITSTALVVRTGVLKRQTLTAPLERIRSVDLEATLLHRLLALRKVQIGTGVDDGSITLDSLGAEPAEALHHRLLAMRAATGPTRPPHGAPGRNDESGEPRPSGADGARTDGTQPDVLATFDPGWARFAPFSLLPLALAAAAIGAVSQLDLPFGSTGEAIWDWLIALSLGALLLVVILGGLLAWCATTMVGYLVQWWNLRLVRQGGNLRLTRGLFTTTSTTVEEARVRGVELTEPVLLRAVGGARLSALVTGLEDGTYAVLPQVPREVAVGVAQEILAGDHPPERGATAALDLDLHPHGSSARRRALIRGVRAWGGLATVAVVGLWFADWLSPLWGGVALVAAVAWGLFVGDQSYRHLGHRLTERHLVVGAASLTRTRSVLERDGIIGWVIAANWFQRRLGLTSLTATTAAGSESVVLVDLPRAEAEALVRETTPVWV